MSGSRARRVRRDKALKAMYCPNDAKMGPHMSIEQILREAYANMSRIWADSFRLPTLACLQKFGPYKGGGAVFPVKVER